jgi:hypothetical protein
VANKILRFLVGISIIGLMVYALINSKGSSYISDGSSQEAIRDQIETDKIEDYKYQNSLEGKYNNNDSDTTFTNNGDTVIFYITTDTLKKND